MGTSIAENVSIRDFNHQYTDPNTSIKDQGYFGSPINIGRDVWIGCGAVILSGVTIGDGSVIAANAVVNKDVPKYSIYGGVPAKKLKNRQNED